MSYTPKVSAANSQLIGTSFYIDTANNFAATQAAAWRASRPGDAAMMDTIANQPKAFWMGSWTPNSQQSAADYVNRARAAAKMGVIVAYNIPNRDCGSYSAGGADSHASYRAWIDGLAAGIGNRQTVVVVEPDALAQLDCLPDAAGKQARLDSLSYAVTKLKASGAIVYLDAGNKGWLSAAEAASRLQQANVANADGFSLNVSNFYTNEESTVYGNDVANRLGGKHYIIDTSRNGLGAGTTWCNPVGRALGSLPSSSTGVSLVDAFLWIKGPGESDGTCNGGPAAGTWWPEYALSLAQPAASPAAAAAPPASAPPTATPPATNTSPPSPNTRTTAPAPTATRLPTAPAAVQETTAVISKSVSGEYTLPAADVANGDTVAVTVDGRPTSATVVDTRQLTNGRHEITVLKTDKNGVQTISRQIILVSNKLTPFQALRSKSPIYIAGLIFASLPYAFIATRRKLLSR